MAGQARTDLRAGQHKRLMAGIPNPRRALRPQYHGSIVRLLLYGHNDWGTKMLVAAFIFVLSFAGLIQFVGLQWRAGLVRVASVAKAGTEGLLKDREFADLAAFQKLCPDLDGSVSKLRSVRLYHGFLQISSALGAAEWAKGEMKLCAQYAAAVFIQQVQQNQAVAAEVNSF